MNFISRWFKKDKATEKSKKLSHDVNDLYTETVDCERLGITPPTDQEIREHAKEIGLSDENINKIIPEREEKQAFSFPASNPNYRADKNKRRKRKQIQKSRKRNRS